MVPAFYGTLYLRKSLHRSMKKAGNKHVHVIIKFSDQIVTCIKCCHIVMHLNGKASVKGGEELIKTPKSKSLIR